MQSIARIWIQARARWLQVISGYYGLLFCLEMHLQRFYAELRISGYFEILFALKWVLGDPRGRDALHGLRGCLELKPVLRAIANLFYFEPTFKADLGTHWLKTAFHEVLVLRKRSRKF